MLPLGGEQGTGSRRAEAGKDGTTDGDAQALPDDAPGREHARRDPLFGGPRGPHERARVGCLEESLADAGEDETPQDVRNGTVRQSG